MRAVVLVAGVALALLWNSPWPALLGLVLAAMPWGKRVSWLEDFHYVRRTDSGGGPLCPRCHGSGNSMAPGWSAECPACGGSGRAAAQRF